VRSVLDLHPPVSAALVSYDEHFEPKAVSLCMTPIPWPDGDGRWIVAKLTESGNAVSPDYRGVSWVACIGGVHYAMQGFASIPAALVSMRDSLGSR
jgi:hypothetical protein